MAPMLFRGLKGVNISCTSPAASSTATFVTPSFFLASKNNGQNKKKKRSPSDDDKPTHSFSPSSSSRCLLLRDDSSSSFSSACLEAVVDPPPPDLDLDDPRFPGMIRFDPSRFHFSEGHGASDLNSSASLSRAQPCHGVGGFRASTSSWSPAVTYFIDEAAKEKEEEEYGVHLGKDELSTKTASPLRGSGSRELQPKDNVGFRVSTTSPSTPSGRDLVTTSASNSSSSRDQVVVLRVSLHCKGCEKKVRKHLSRMQGVTSFSIDFGAKKVTVVGEVTPLGVLSSVSKVKNAELWTSPTRTPSTRTAWN